MCTTTLITKPVWLVLLSLLIFAAAPVKAGEGSEGDERGEGGEGQSLFGPSDEDQDPQASAEGQDQSYHLDYSKKGATLDEALAAQNAASIHFDAPVQFTNSLGMKFMLIPPGTFMMGSPKEEIQRTDDEAQFKVILTRPYYLSTTEVTQAQWKEIMGTRPLPSIFKGANLPEEQFHWDDAVVFCLLLSQKEGRTYKLPTEAQWEHACRAGTVTPFNWDSDIPSTTHANYSSKDLYNKEPRGRTLGKTTPVGSYVANRWGLFDMHGNVLEWCADWYGPYPTTTTTDPLGAVNGKERVVRGGAYFLCADLLRSAARTRVPSNFGADIGLRVLLELPEPERQAAND